MQRLAIIAVVVACCCGCSDREPLYPMSGGQDTLWLEGELVRIGTNQGDAGVQVGLKNDGTVVWRIVPFALQPEQGQGVTDDGVQTGQ